MRGWSAIQVESLVSRIDHDRAEAARPAIAARGLRARLAGREVLDWAGEVLEIAEGGLERLGHLNRQREDERIHLVKLRTLIEKGMTPADAILADIDAELPLLPQLLEKARV